MFEIQKSGDKTSLGEIGLDIRTYASPKVGQDQVSNNISMILKVLKTRHVLTDIVIGERCFSDAIFSLQVADKLIFHCV